MRRLLLLALLLAFADVIYGQCATTMGGQSSGPNYVWLRSQNTLLNSAVSNAASMWSQPCWSSSGGMGFPIPLTQAPSGSYEILDVYYNAGFHPTSPDQCGQITFSTGRIDMYEKATVSGVTVLCNSYGYSQNIAHELGHYYGLDHPASPTSCTGDIMQAFNGYQHYVSSENCAQADDQQEVLGDYSYTGNCNQPCAGPCDSTTGNCTAYNPSPLLVDLEGNRFELSGPDDPVTFDLTVTGSPGPTAWTARGSSAAFLALDRDGDGAITSGAELFGDRTMLQDGYRAANGFEALKEFDSAALGGNGDGRIDDRDRIYAELLVWQDLDHDGFSDPIELSSAADAGLLSIDLEYRLGEKRDRYGNAFRYRGSAVRRNAHGVAHPVVLYDVFFTRP